MNPLWLLRMRRWAQSPPRPRNVALLLVLLAALLALYGAERAGWLPEWLALAPEGAPGRVLR
ncbi:hypothetical protein [Roseivivax sp. CAU 1761]